MSELKVINSRLTKTDHGRVCDLGSMINFLVLPNSTQVLKKVVGTGLYEHIGTLDEPLGEQVWNIIYGGGARHDSI